MGFVSQHMNSKGFSIEIATCAINEKRQMRYASSRQFLFSTAQFHTLCSQGHSSPANVFKSACSRSFRRLCLPRLTSDWTRSSPFLWCPAPGPGRTPTGIASAPCQRPSVLTASPTRVSKSSGRNCILNRQRETESGRIKRRSWEIQAWK